MEKIEDFKMVREGVVSNSNFVAIVLNYFRDFRMEHLFDTIKFKEERITGCPVRYFREDGKRKMSYGVLFTITFFTDCRGDLFIMFDDGESHLTTIPVHCGDSVPAIEKLVEMIEGVKGGAFPYVSTDINIDAKVYE